MGLSGVQIVCLVAMVLAVAWLVVLDRPKVIARETRRVTTKLPFALTHGAAQRLRRRVIRDQRAAPIAVGAAAGTLFVATAVDAGAAAVPVFAALMGIVVVAQLVAPFHHSAELALQPVSEMPRGLRMARLRRAAVSDYVRRLDMSLVRVTVGSVIMLTGWSALCAIVGPEELLPSAPALALGSILLLATMAVEGGARVSVRRARPAASAAALMSDDAITSYALRTAYTSLGAISYSSASALLLLSSANGAVFDQPMWGLFLLATSAWMVASVGLSVDSSVRYFLVRLWDMPSGLPVMTFVPARPGNPYRGGPS